MAANEILQALNMMLDRKERREDREAAKSLALLSMSLQEESRKTDRAQDVMLKEYYSKQEEVAAYEKMYDEYSNLSPQDISPGGKDLVSIVNDQNEIDMGQINESILKLNEYKSELSAGLQNISKQQSDFKQYESTYWGENKMLQPHEYEQMKEFALKSIDDGGLGYSNTAGFDRAYEAIPGSTREAQAITMSDNISKSLKETSADKLSIIKGALTKTKDNDPMKTLTYVHNKKTYKPSEAIVNELVNIASQVTTPEEFMDAIYQAEQVGVGNPMLDFLRTNKRLAKAFSTMEDNVLSLNALSDELAGILPEEKVSEMAEFASSVEGITDTDLLFQMFEESAQGKTQKEYQDYFAVLETELGQDLGEAYDLYSNPETGEDVDRGPEGIARVPIVKALSGLASTAQHGLIGGTAEALNVLYGPMNYLSHWLTGYNPGFSGHQTMSGLGFDFYFDDLESEGFFNSSAFDEAISHPGGLGRGRSEWDDEAVRSLDLFSPHDDIPEWYRSTE